MSFVWVNACRDGPPCFMQTRYCEHSVYVNGPCRIIRFLEHGKTPACGGTHSVSLLWQVASTSRANPYGARIVPGGRGGSGITTAVSVPRPETPSPLCRTPHERTSTAPPPKVPEQRSVEHRPEGHNHVSRTPQPCKPIMAPPVTVDLCTPPDGADTDKRRANDKRNLTRNVNKQAHAAFVREMKDSLAAGRPPSLNGGESATHLKVRWHTVAKTVAYQILDLTKESWKEYTIHDKGLVYRALNEQFQFDPPIDARRVEKYLCGHLRSSRAVWKAHWQKYGDHNRHLHCPEEAWETLIKWWPTQACKEESKNMAERRKLVQNRSTTGRKRMVDRMDEEVSLLHPVI